MRKPILAIALISVFSCPLASFAGTTSANSEQRIQGEHSSSSSAGVSDNRLYEELPPLAKDANVNSGASANSTTSTAHAAAAPTTDTSEVRANVQSYAWTK